jgi:hypothetical protein
MAASAKLACRQLPHDACVASVPRSARLAASWAACGGRGGSRGLPCSVSYGVCPEVEAMTESEFATCTDPLRMLGSLLSTGRASERKLRLFGVACVRRAWHLLRDERSCRAVEVAELYADGVAHRGERANAEADAKRAADGMRGRDWFVAVAAKMAVASHVPLAAVVSYTPVDDLLRPEEIEARKRGQSGLLRDVFGPLPFRPVEFDPSWRLPAVVGLATAIYEDRRFADMPILADALEEAGANNQELLTHLREQGPGHVLGCWALDVILGKP